MRRQRRRIVRNNTDLLLEIGTEELPAAYLDGAIAQLRDDAQRLLGDAHLAHGAVESFGTPRRLVLIVRALSAVQRHPAEAIRGPSKYSGFDSNGNPTPALQGFLRSRGGTVQQLKTVAEDKGEYLYLLKPASSVPSANILPEMIQRLITGLRFPKTMRWDDGGLRFARPIRWLLALHGSTPIRLRVGRLAGAPSTVVGGPKHPRKVPARTLAVYHAALKRDGVLLDQAVRRQRILALVTSLAKQHKGVVAEEMVSHGLLEEVTYLVERPAGFVGQFDPTYLALPREVLLASMAKHQRVFAVQSRDAALLPKFVAILDGAPRPAALSRIRLTYDHILNARLADAMLFWTQDRTRSLNTMATQLAGVTFHEKLGSMAQKQERLQKLAPVLAAMWSLSSDESERLQRACEIAKADLVSTMVKEFPTLQGVMGKYYTLEQGEPREVAEAIEEQYLPLAGKAPKMLIGSALAVVDKYDTLSTYFAIGIEPTGDQDPFGLRRAAQGVVEVAWAAHRPLPLSALFRANWSTAPFRNLEKDALRKVEERVQRYLLERLYTFAWPAPSPGRDLIDAVLSSPCDDVIDAMDRIRSLRQLDGNRSLLKAAKVIERTRNILKGASAVPVHDPDPAKFQEPLERQLWERYTTHKDRLMDASRAKRYAEATTAYGEAFYETIHDFFDRVMVNVKEADIQQNRLALMRSINALYTERIADLSKLTILQEGPASPRLRSGRSEARRAKEGKV